MNKLGKVLVALLLAAVLQTTAFSQTGYSITDNNIDATATPQQLYSFNINTGNATRLSDAALGIDNGREYEGLASIGSVLYGVAEFAGTANPNLSADLRVFGPNRTTGLQVGNTGINFGTESAAAYNPQDGFIYSIASDDTLPSTGIRSKLYRISPTSGVATLVADITLAAGSGGEANPYLDGLAITTNGTVYASEARIGANGGLYRLNLTNGQATFVGGFGFGDQNLDTGLANNGNAVVLLLEDGRIFSVNTTNGTATGSATRRINVGGTAIQGDFEGFDIPAVPIR